MNKSKIVILILENLRSVENAASIFRTAECLGVSGIILTGTTPTPTDRFGRKRKDFAKVSLGTEKMVEWAYVKIQDLRFRIQDLRTQGFQIISLEQGRRAKNIKSFKPKNKFVLIVGNEVTGVSRIIIDISDAIVEIPMRGKKESLNVSVATGIALFVLR